MRSHSQIRWPRRIAIAYLYFVGFALLFTGITGFFVRGLSAVMILIGTAQQSAETDLVVSVFRHFADPDFVIEYEWLPLSNAEWLLFSTTITIIAVLAIKGARAISRDEEIGYRIWRAIVAWFLLASVANLVLINALHAPVPYIFVIGPLIPLAWAISYFVAYRVAWKSRIAPVGVTGQLAERSNDRAST